MPAVVPYRVHKSRLPNGLAVATVDTPHLHTATVALFVRAGSRYETPSTNGLSHFVEHMLFRGCKAHPSSLALNLAIEERGGTLYAETGRDYSLFQVSLPPQQIDHALQILGDLFTHPTFSDIDLERSIILEELLEDLDERGRNVNLSDRSRAEVWPDHALGYSIIGPARNLRRYKQADIARHFRRFYGARNMALCVAGKVDPRHVRTVAARAFSALPSGARMLPRRASRPALGPNVRAIWNDSAQIQAHVLFHALPESDRASPALSLLLRLIDDGMSTPLHYRICDQKGLAYNVGASIESLWDTGLVEIDTACAPAKLPTLVEEILKIVDGFRRAPVTEVALARAKRRYEGDLQASFDDVPSLAAWFGGAELFFRPYTHEQLLRRTQRVTADAIQKVARRIFQPRRLNVVAVGAVDRAIANRVRRVVSAFSV